MMLSEDRQSHLAHLIVDGIWKDDLVDYTDEDHAIRAGKLAVSNFFKKLSDLDQKARQKVASLKRNVAEGTPEWDIMYNKYLEEEMQKSGNN